MSSLAHRLQDLRPQLVQCAIQHLARGEAVRPMLDAEVLRFFERLIDAVESGSLEWLQGLMRDWVAARPLSVGRERQTFIPILHALRSASWEIISSTWPPEGALSAILTLEHFFAETSLYLSQLESEARLIEAEAMLKQGQARIERLEKSKSDFIAVAAHELRTPLTLIQGYAALLADDVPADLVPRVQVLLTGLATATQRLHEIIEDMVDVSLIDNDMLDLHYEVTDLRWLLTQAFTEAQQHLDGRQLTLKFEVAEALETHADSTRLYQVFQNLLSNAVKFTPDGGTVTVRSRELPGFIEVTVADTGIGIAPENQERIFQRFVPVGDVTQHFTSKTKFKGGGVGLGLPIARGIAEGHGGTLWVESPGHDEARCPGSVFHIILPRRAQPPPDKTPKLFELFVGDEWATRLPRRP
jgi:signal transduction histidine kinase